MPQYLTVVYTINDIALFEPMKQEIFDGLSKSDDVPYATTAVSCDHEMQRLHWIEEAVNHIEDHYDLRDTIENILGSTDIGNVASLDDLRSL